jgi:hypothetical protein
MARHSEWWSCFARSMRVVGERRGALRGTTPCCPRCGSSSVGWRRWRRWQKKDCGSALLLLVTASSARAGRSGGGAKARWSGLRCSDAGAMHGDAVGSDLTRTERGREGGGRMSFLRGAWQPYARDSERGLMHVGHAACEPCTVSATFEVSTFRNDRNVQFS